MKTIPIEDMDARDLRREISEYRDKLDNLPDDTTSEQRDTVQGYVDRCRRELDGRIDRAIAAYLG
jgi:hypothetical protein